MDWQMRELQSELKELKERVAYLEKNTGFSYSTASQEQQEQIEKTAILSSKPAPAASVKSPLAPTKPEPVPFVKSFLPPTKPRPAAHEKTSMSHGMSEEKLGGTLFNRLGILAILLAVAFFLKWSFDNNLINELGRIMIGLVLGLGFLGAGEYFQRKKYYVYGQGFTGGGIAILYFSIFAAFFYYHLLSQPVSFVLMILITMAAALLAIRYDSLAVGILGIIGGFATPFLLSTGQGNRLVLFSYVAILDAGVLLVAYFKRWPLFTYITFALTYITYTSGFNSPGIKHIQKFDTMSLAFLTLYFLMYLGVSFIENFNLGKKDRQEKNGLILLATNTLVYIVLAYDILIHYPVILYIFIFAIDAGALVMIYWKKWQALIYASFFFTYIYFIAGLSSRYSIKFDTISFSFLTLFFLVYLTVIFMEKFRNSKPFKWADILITLLNGIFYLGLSLAILHDVIRGWEGFWAAFLGLIYLLMGTLIYRKYPATKIPSLTLLAMAAGFITLAVPLQLEGYWIPMVWGVEAVVALYAQIKLDSSKIPWIGLLIMGLTITWLLFLPFQITGQEMWVLLNKTAIAYLVVILSMAVFVWIYQKESRLPDAVWNRSILRGLQIILNLLIVIFLTREVNAYYHYLRLLSKISVVSQIQKLQDAENLTISIIWGLHSAVLIALGFWRHLRDLRWLGLGFLGVVIFKVFLYDLSNLTTLYRILSFMGLGIILLAVSWLYNRYKHLIIGDNEEDDDNSKPENES